MPMHMKGCTAPGPLLRFAARLAEARDQCGVRLLRRDAYGQFRQQGHAFGHFVQIGLASQIAHDEVGHGAGCADGAGRS
jgi:hypothetical protein